MKIRLSEINKHVSDGINKDSENQKGAKEFSKSEAELVDVMDTFQRATSIIEKEMAKNLAFLQKEIDTGKTNSIRTALIRMKTSRSIAFSSVDDDEAYQRADHRRFTRKHSRFRWDRSVLVRKDWHSENSRRCSQHVVAKIAVIPKDRRDSIRN